MATTRRPRRTTAPYHPALALLAVVVLVLTGAGTAGAQPAPSEIADDIADTGAYVEEGFGGGPEVDAAIEEANDDRIAVVLLDTDTDAVPLSRQILQEQQSQGGDYRTVLVVTNSSAGAASSTVDDIGSILSDGQPAFEALAQGRTADGIRAFTAEVTGTAEQPVPVGDRDDGGSSFPWIPLVVVVALAGLAAGGWWLVKERRTGRQAQQRFEAERAELGEQLRNNADRVISLGDAVMASDDAELVDLYAEASSTYRDVSHRMDSATTIEVVRQLGGRLDEAEWQFEVIEARLAGRPPPPRPTQVAEAGPGGDGAGGRSSGGVPPPPRAPADGRPNDDGPVLARDETLFGTTLPPAAPGRVPWAGRGRSRRGAWRGGRR